jgi:choline dehydrogenase-like flavoprotein
LGDHPVAERIDNACAELGLHPFKSSMAILPAAHDGRAPCFYCRFCAGYGCPTKSKSSTAVTFVRKALTSGNCDLRTECFVFRIELDRRGHASRVHYIGKDGARHTARAKLVCLACSAIETARLLLLSATSTQRHGLANSSGQLGRNLMFSAHSDVAAFVRFDGPADDLRSRNPFVLRSVQDFYRLPHRRWPEEHLPHPAGGTISFYAPADNVAAKAKWIARAEGSRPLWGHSLKEALRRRLRDSYVFAFETFGEFLANEQTRVALSSNYKDQWGFPVAHLTVRPHAATRASNHYLTARGLEILQAIGIDRADIFEHSIGSINPVLIYGTCRAGDDQTTAVLNRWCRTHDVPNLFVTDGSFMPTSGGVPGTFTIMANALRVAEHIRDEELARLL